MKTEFIQAEVHAIKNSHFPGAPSFITLDTDNKLSIARGYHYGVNPSIVPVHIHITVDQSFMRGDLMFDNRALQYGRIHEFDSIVDYPFKGWYKSSFGILFIPDQTRKVISTTNTNINAKYDASMNFYEYLVNQYNNESIDAISEIQLEINSETKEPILNSSNHLNIKF